MTFISKVWKIIHNINLKEINWIPSHPIAGTEESGPKAGYADMFENRWCIISPPKNTTEKPIKILRPFNVFGETQSNKAVIPELIEKFINNETVKITKGVQTREFNYVGNTVNLIIQASKEKRFFNNITFIFIFT